MVREKKQQIIWNFPSKNAFLLDVECFECLMLSNVFCAAKKSARGRRKMSETLTTIGQPAFYERNSENYLQSPSRVNLQSDCVREKPQNLLKIKTTKRSLFSRANHADRRHTMFNQEAVFCDIFQCFVIVLAMFSTFFSLLQL